MSVIDGYVATTLLRGALADGKPKRFIRAGDLPADTKVKVKSLDYLREISNLKYNLEHYQAKYNEAQIKLGQLEKYSQTAPEVMANLIRENAELRARLKKYEVEDET